MRGLKIQLDLRVMDEAVFSLVSLNYPDFQLVRREAESSEDVPMPNDGHESGISDVT